MNTIRLAKRPSELACRLPIDEDNGPITSILTWLCVEFAG